MRANAIEITTIGTSVSQWFHWIFLKTSYKNRSERQMQFYSIDGSFVDVKEGAALILVLKL